MLRSNILKTRLNAGETVFGITLASAHATIAEMIGLAGFDYVLIDAEHGIGGRQDHLRCLQAIAGTAARAILRVESADPALLKRALDLGVDGIMVPNVGSAEEARAIVAACRYPPHGVRGYAASGVRASDYGFQTQRYLQSYAAELLVCVIIESRAGMQNAASIAATEGIDLIQVGANDLAYDLGVPEQLGHPSLLDGIARIEAAAKANATALGGAPLPQIGVRDLVARGYGLVTLGRDLGILARGLTDSIAGEANRRN